jgi:hypothetical protein
VPRFSGIFLFFSEIFAGNAAKKSGCGDLAYIYGGEMFLEKLIFLKKTAFWRTN